MTSPKTKSVLTELGTKHDNDRCFECGAHNPQWASATYGIWICLECLLLLNGRNGLESVHKDSHSDL